MATPHAAGLAALLLQAKSTLTPAEVKQIYMETALDMGQGPNAQGAGRARAKEALDRSQGGELPEEPPPTTPQKGCLPSFLIPIVGR